jgi:methylated-DNA-[protein]-cysteine S-methyltransferase
VEEPGVIFSYASTPIGDLLVAKNGGGVLAEIRFAHDGHPAPAPKTWSRDDRALADVVKQLRAYFAGELREFELPLAAHGTAFQERVWGRLRAIPYGATTTYGAIARDIGHPEAVRAVGAANGANPIPIVVPCHRVVGSDGSLTGFGGGIEVKRWLLAHEARTAGQRLF